MCGNARTHARARTHTHTQPPPPPPPRTLAVRALFTWWRCWWRRRVRARVCARVCGCGVVWPRNTSTTTPSLRLALVRLRQAKRLHPQARPTHQVYHGCSASSSHTPSAIINCIKIIMYGHQSHQVSQVCLSISSSSSSSFIKFYSVHQVNASSFDELDESTTRAVGSGSRSRWSRSPSVLINCIKLIKYDHLSHQVYQVGLSISSISSSLFIKLIALIKSTHEGLMGLMSRQHGRAPRDGACARAQVAHSA